MDILSGKGAKKQEGAKGGRNDRRLRQTVKVYLPSSSSYTNSDYGHLGFSDLAHGTQVFDNWLLIRKELIFHTNFIQPQGKLSKSAHIIIPPLIAVDCNCRTKWRSLLLPLLTHFPWGSHMWRAGCWKESDELINYTEISRVEEGTFVSVVWTPL